MIRSFKFLLRPTGGQEASLKAMLDDHRDLYNAALEERRTAYRQCGVSLKYGSQSAQLKDIRRFDPDGQGRWSFNSQQATLRQLDRAFMDFFRRVKSGRAPGYPRFKAQRRFNMVTFPLDGCGVRWNAAPEAKATRLRLQGVGHVKVHQHRPVVGKVKTVSVKREGAQWYVVLACDVPIAEALPATGAVVGIDMGIASFLTTSDGEHVDNPRHRRKTASKLAAAQQALSRCKRGSNRRKRVRAQVAAIHAKIRRQRYDHAHKVALALVRTYDVIAHEDLHIADMVRTPKARVDPERADAFLSNGAAAKAGLNAAIYDAGWGVFLEILNYKAESAGRLLISVNPANTSRTCPGCGHCAAENRTTQEKFLCVSCGHAAHADVVGALNVLRAGLALREAAAKREDPSFAGEGVTSPVAVLPQPAPPYVTLIP